MDETGARYAILFTSLASLIGCLVIFGSFIVCKEWRLQFSSRFLLMGMTIYTAFFCLTYAVFIGGVGVQLCDFQAAALQYFGLGMVMHQALISFELYRDILQLTRDAESTVGPPLSIVSEDDDVDVTVWEMYAQVPRKYWLFELAVFIYNGYFFCIVMLYHNSARTPGASFSCTLANEGGGLRLSFELLPGYICFAIVLWCDCLVLHRLFKLLGRRDTFLYATTVNLGQRSFAAAQRGSCAVRTSSEIAALAESPAQAWYPGLWWRNMQESFERLDERSRATVLRLMVTPVFYSALGVCLPLVWLLFPGSVVYVLLTELCGFANCIGWVLLNAPLRQLWSDSLRRWCAVWWCKYGSAPDETDNKTVGLLVSAGDGELRTVSSQLL